jgi:5-oxoprolinase (ATP-hydrolysing) subunit A
MPAVSRSNTYCMFTIDLNCDMGEGIGNDALIMPYISSANIACGYHAGDETTMKETIELALKHLVAIGAHISFNDRKNFGRTEMHLSADETRALVLRQLTSIDKIAKEAGAKLVHIKPHGALYNMSAKDITLAALIAKAVKEYDEQLVLFGLSGSESIEASKAMGLRTASEVFADRTYQDDGSLTPRSVPGALIEEEDKAIAQVLQMVKNKKVKAVSGKEIPVTADTICIHGDGKNAVAFAKKISATLRDNGCTISAFKLQQ